MPRILAEHVIKIRYDGGSAEDHQLPLYDGTTSIQGISQALQIATHAYLNDEIVTRATALRGARMFLRPPKRGSFLIELIALIEKYPATSTALVAISAPVFYDFIKVAFKKATGFLSAEPETTHLKKTFERQEPFFDELAETLEGSLQRGHRVIGDDITSISIGRARSDIVLFDQSTKNWVNTREEVPAEERATGNVTRFNSITRNGRMYVDQLRRIVPFKPDGDFPAGRMGLLTWSLHGSNTDLPKKLELKVRHVKSALGESKRFLLADCKRLEK